ncbi:hypothetical protein KSP39_PZI016563 [Platanthera zijinensis]|uniref:RNA-directed DNA polymerase n=1 Tax=Platanthera zijinensis TaxID=2320716 RepID=A0AAP0B7K6_9ASPA
MDTRATEMRRDIDLLKTTMEQRLDDLTTQIAALVAARPNAPNPAPPADLPDDDGPPAFARHQHAHRLPRIDFPRFNGDNLLDWIYCCDRYFDVEETPDNLKVRLASIHLDGKALQWHQVYVKNRLTCQPPAWEEYLQALRARFGGHIADEPMAEIKRLRQHGSVQLYVEQFEELINRLTVADEYAVSLFITGLQHRIEKAVRMFAPQDLPNAIRLAKLQEQLLSGPTPQPRQPALLPPPSHQPRKPFSPAELADKKARGLCMWCDEKYFPGHRCLHRRQIYILEGEDVDLDVPTTDSAELPVPEEVPPGTPPLLSMHAMTGTPTFNTMRVTGTHHGKALHILIDTGSTHNFLNERTARRLGWPLKAIPPFSVAVADGNRLTSAYSCSNFPWRMQGRDFAADMLTLDLGGCDMVLGIQWLVTLGPIVWDFNKLRMEFTMSGNKVSLRGGSRPPTDIITRRQLAKLVQRPAELSMLGICLLQNQPDKPPPAPLQHPPELQTLLAEFANLFGTPTGLPPSRSHDHHIPLQPNTPPISIRPYRSPALQKNEIERLIAEMLRDGLIRHSVSPYSSPIVLVKKKDGSWRLCVDYRELNKHTIKDKFPIPLVDELLDELHGARFFSKLDLRSGYHQVRMAPADIHKTAFRSHHGHYEFLVMPFGLTNAPSTFQSLMNRIFAPHLRKFVLVFFDDIMIYSSSWDAHLRHLRLAFQLLRHHQLFLKSSKCSFGTTSVDYLGHVISHHGVTVDPGKVRDIQSWPRPHSLKTLRGFLGLTGYYRRFIQGYGSLAKPLTELLRLPSFQWSSQADAAFLSLQHALSTAPVLALPDFSREFTIETDASNVGVGAVLSQDSHPIAYFSKALGPRNLSLSAYEKEMLAIVWAVSKWRAYLLGRHFVIKTDHQSLKHLLEQRVSTPAQHRYLAKLMGFDYTITYKSGKENIAADALSRLPEPPPQLIRQLTADPSTHPHYSWANNHLRRKGKLVVGADPATRHTIIKLYHDSPTGGHSGIRPTVHRLRQLFYWKNLKSSVHDHIQRCTVCQQCKTTCSPPAGLLQPLPIPDRVWQDISMDFIEGLPLSHGKDVILVVVDRLSKYAHFIALRHPYTALTVAQAFMDSIFRLHGMPSSIVSDRDPVFLSSCWQEFFRLHNVELHTSTAYHPQSDGQTEVVNRCLEGYLRCMTFDNPAHWANWLPLAEWWYNTTFHSAINTTPYEVLYGQPPPLHLPYIAASSMVDTVDRSLAARECTLASLKQQLQHAQNRMKQQADRHRVEREYHTGSWVYVRLQPYRQTSLRPHANQKLAPRYFGPFRILQRVGPVAYKLLLPDGCRLHHTFHVSQLKAHVGNAPTTSAALPTVTDEGYPLVEPQSVLDRRLVQRRGKPATQLLIQWSHSPPEDATWEFLFDLRRRFPNFSP